MLCISEGTFKKSSNNIPETFGCESRCFVVKKSASFVSLLGFKTFKEKICLNLMI